MKFQEDYVNFLKSKQLSSEPSGFTVDQKAISPVLFDFQRDIVRWALKRGKAAVFALTGLGKTLIQVAWSRHVHIHTGGNILIVAPLAVSSQTAREALKLNESITICKSQADVQPGINITNYERLEKFDPDAFVAVVLDESGILKNFTGATRNAILDMFQETPYKLACTATPAPNDFTELGNHAEFLGAMSRSEMLAMFFVHDGGDTSKWRLKGHAEHKFWEWVSSWAVMLQSPTDLGYDGSLFELPPLHIEDVVVESQGVPEGFLFWTEARTLQERQAARRETIEERVLAVQDVIGDSQEKWLVWCGLNAEQDALEKCFDGRCVSVRGATPPDEKIELERQWREGDMPILISKSSIFGWGMNWQHCSRMVFVGLNDSFESVFQAIRRCYRFGQTREVRVYMITSDREGAVSQNIKRKEQDFERMLQNMLQHTSKIMAENVHSLAKTETVYDPKIAMKIPNWLVTNPQKGDENRASGK